MTKEPKINIVLLPIDNVNYRIAIPSESINDEFSGEIISVGESEFSGEIISVGENGYPYGSFEGMKALIEANRKILTAYATQPLMDRQEDLLFEMCGGHIGYEQTGVILNWKNQGVHLAETPKHMLPNDR